MNPVKDALEEMSIHFKELNDAIAEIEACQSIIVGCLEKLGDNVREAKESLIGMPVASLN